ncbi:hypothetical protein TRAPUB_12396 [Trametes pubescens]|uniref:Pseudouridine synthase RsuA/RluA-like domain-containing protein n=1 Tax=Trametes pubescens TaxID=154538 RepID=A0A1M2VUA4_TRAPU|nr:hypothetical protein TRAPUB_12396 [Trametes pubescens]
MNKPTVMRALKKATQRAKPAENNGYLLKQLKPQNLILYADKTVVAINKPRGLVCQPSRPINDRHFVPAFVAPNIYGPLKKFRLGLGAPIPSGFDAVCKAAQIELDVDQRSGGVWLDNHKVRGAGSEDYQKQRSISEKGDIEDAVSEIGGVWYGDRDQ